MRTVLLPASVKCAHRKAITNEVIRCLEAGKFHDAMLDIKSLAYAPWPNVHRVRRLVNLHVTYGWRAIDAGTSGYRAHHIRHAIALARELTKLPSGWLAVEGGAR